MERLIRFSWVFGVLGFFSLVLSGSLAFVFRAQTPQVTGFAVAAMVFLLAYGALDRERLGQAASSRSFIYGSGSGLMVLMAGGIAVFGFVLADDHDKTWDFTVAKSFSLSEQTRGVLAGLDEDVEILAFFQDSSQSQREFRSLIRRYEVLSPQIKVRFIDPMRSPLEAEQNKITNGAGTVIIRKGEAERRLDSGFEESDINRALLLMAAGADHTICWSLGHGEPDPRDDMAQRGFGAIVSMLEGLNYKVSDTHVMTTGIDRSCEALVVMNPVLDWFPFEREALAAYLAEGGQVFAALDVGQVPDLAGELERYGVHVGDDIVLDANPMNMLSGVQDPSMVVLTADNFQPHPITQSLSAVVLGMSRSVAPIPQSEGFALTTVLKTSDQAWGETDLDGADGEPQPNPDHEQVGEVPVMVVSEVLDPAAIGVVAPTVEDERAAVVARVVEAIGIQLGADPAAVVPEARLDALSAQADVVGVVAGMQALFGVSLDPDNPPQTVQDVIDGVLAGRALQTDPSAVDLEAAVSKAVPQDFTPKAGGRLVVIGDADFVNNQLVKWGNNKDLFLNTLAWLVDEPDQISERPDEGDVLEISLVGTLSLALLTFVLAPGAALLAAFLTAVRRWRL